MNNKYVYFKDTSYIPVGLFRPVVSCATFYYVYIRNNTIIAVRDSKGKRTLRLPIERFLGIVSYVLDSSNL